MPDPNWRLDREQAARDLLGAQREQIAQENGWEPGDFVLGLLEAMYRADATNLWLLGIPFPAHAWAVDQWKNHERGREVLGFTAGWVSRVGTDG